MSMPKLTPYQKLAASLADEQVQSAYLDRLRARIDPAQAQKELENEIAGEIAKALGRTEEQLLLALAELDLCAARYARARDTRSDPGALTALAAAFNAQRELCEKRLRDLVIHREAAGFRRNQKLYELYPIPARIKP